MTGKILQTVVEEAAARWQFNAYEIVHRVGELGVNEQIVLVGIASSHRAEAFAAAEFIMDALKTSAPFWKKELTPDKHYWVEAKHSDQTRRQKWED